MICYMQWSMTLVLLMVAALAHAGTKHYYYTDPQGTPLAKADASGNITARFEYTPYGVPVTSMGAAPDGVGYTGHVNDPETGLVYMQARYYDAEVGRFLSVDSVGPSPGELFHFNRYNYTNNNPINHTDPDGQAPDTDFGLGAMARSAGQHPDQMKPAFPFMIGGLAYLTGTGEVYGAIKVISFIRRVFIKADPKITRDVKQRKTPGADGGRSTITTETDVETGDTISVTHKVEVNGKIVHQHQDHVGKSGAKKTFSDELTGNKTIGEGKYKPKPKDQKPTFPPRSN